MDRLPLTKQRTASDSTTSQAGALPGVELICLQSSLLDTLYHICRTAALGGCPEGNKMSEYIRFGDEWKREVMKMKKANIVEMLAKALAQQAAQQDADTLPAPACCASFVAYGVHHKDCRFAQKG